jgi:hypothetical protein
MGNTDPVHWHVPQLMGSPTASATGAAVWSARIMGGLKMASGPARNCAPACAHITNPNSDRRIMYTLKANSVTP